MPLTYRIMYPPMSSTAASRIGGGDFRKAWTPMSGVLIRSGGGTNLEFPASIAGIEHGGALSQIRFHIPMTPDVLEQMGRAFLDLAAIARERVANDAVIRRALRL